MWWMGAAKWSAKIYLSSCIHLPQLLASSLTFSNRISLVKPVLWSLFLLHYRHRQTEQQYRCSLGTKLHMDHLCIGVVLHSSRVLRPQIVCASPRRLLYRLKYLWVQLKTSVPVRVFNVVNFFFYWSGCCLCFPGCAHLLGHAAGPKPEGAHTDTPIPNGGELCTTAIQPLLLLWWQV